MEKAIAWESVEPKIQEVLDELVNKKKADWPFVFMTGGGGGLLLSCLIACFIGYSTIFLVIALFIGMLVAYFYKESKRNEIYKQKVMPRLLELVCPGATYNPKGDMPYRVISSSKLLRTGLDYHNEDTIRGKVGNTDFVYGEAKFSHMEGTGKNRHEVIDFKGFVFEADFNKDFNGITVLSSQGFKLWSNVVFSKFSRCHLEDARFENKYRTYATDDQQARYILTPALQERIMNMNHTFSKELGDSDLSMSFHDSRMLIMVPSHTNRFEVKYTAAGVKKDYLALTLMIDIVDMLNLNLRIWSKE